MIASLFRHSLARELVLILTIKLILIVLASIFLFGPGQRPHIGAAAVFKHLFSSPQE